MFNLSLGICIIILLFLVPGALFRKAFNSVKLSDYHNRASSFSEVILTIALSVFIQFLGLLAVEAIDMFCDDMYTVNIQTVSNIISFKNENAFQPIQDHFLLIVSYQLTIYALCILSGRFLLNFIINKKLDQKNLFLRFDNEWHYILTGRILNPNREIVKYANVLVDMDEFYVIYTGVLADYNIDKTGNLKLIELERVKRKVIEKKESVLDKTKEYFFNVNSLFIPYEKILNFSITYFNVEEINEGPVLNTKEKAEKFIGKYFWNKNTLIFLLVVLLVFLLYILTTHKGI